MNILMMHICFVIIYGMVIPFTVHKAVGNDHQCIKFLSLRFDVDFKLEIQTLVSIIVFIMQ